MAKATLSRRRTRRRHVREKATIDHLVRAVWAKAHERGTTTHSPLTASGLSVEDQVRKQWHPGLGGLAVF
jgi:phage gp16-like protein